MTWLGRTLTILGVVLLAACSSSSPGATGPSESAGTPSAPPSPGPASPTPVAASPSAVPAGTTALPTSETQVHLAPGRYAFSGFVPKLTFRAGPGWSSGHALPDFFDIQSPSTVVVFADVGFVYDEQGVRRETDDMTPRQAAGTLVANNALGAGPVRPATVGGVTGASIELTPRSAADIFGRTVVYTVAKDRSYRLTFLDTPTSMLVIMAVAIHRPPDAAFARAKPVVDSVSFV